MSDRYASLFAKGPQIGLDQLIALRHLGASLQLFPASASRSVLSGDYRSRLRGRGMDFDEVRIYQAGDDIRSIDWRVTARTAKAHTKVFKEEKDRPVMIVIDQRASLFFGSRVVYKSVMAAQLGALLAWAGLLQNDKTGGIVFNETHHREIKPQRNKNAVLAFLKAAAEFNSEWFTREPIAQEKINSTPNSNKITLLEVLEKLRRIAKPGSALFIISDFYDYSPEAERLLYLLKRHTDVYALIVADPLEHSLPQQGVYNVTDGTQIFRFNSGDKSLNNDYKRAFEQRQVLVQDSLRKLGISHTTVWTQDNPYRALKDLLRQ